MPRVIDCPTEEKLELGRAGRDARDRRFRSATTRTISPPGGSQLKQARQRPQLPRRHDDRRAEAALRRPDPGQSIFAPRWSCSTRRSDEIRHARQFLAGAEGQRRAPSAAPTPSSTTSRTTTISRSSPSAISAPAIGATITNMIMARWSAIRARAVDLSFVEKARLEQGKVMLYRAHKDVHLQLPADAMSVCLNILETSHCSVVPRPVSVRSWRTSTIAGIMTRTSLEPMLALAAHYGGERGRGPARQLRRGPSQRPHPLVRRCARRPPPRRRSTSGSRSSSEGARSGSPAGQRHGQARERAEDRGRAAPGSTARPPAARSDSSGAT